MSSDAHHVVLSFELVPPLSGREPDACWLGTPRGCFLATDGRRVAVTSVDRSETYARNQVFQVAGEWLRAAAGGVTASLRATLSAPSCRARAEVYAIAVGAAVSIARIDPHGGPVITFARERQLQLV